MHILQPCARWAHKHPTYISQLLAEYIHYRNISANCWQNISNTRIYLPIVGRIYPISEYIQLFIYSQLLAVYIHYPIQIYEIQSAGVQFAGARFAINKFSAEIFGDCQQRSFAFELYLGTS